MTRKELYKKYKGMYAVKQYTDKRGIICGYVADYVNTAGNRTLIMAVTGPRADGWGYVCADAHDIIVTHKRHPYGYLYVHESDVLVEKLSLWKRIMKSFWGK